MRIIEGSIGGLGLFHLPTAGRPTTEKVRGALFSILRSVKQVQEGRILDLFAGSGALGLEALSRGAQSAIFVDHHPLAIECIQRNLRKAQEQVLFSTQVICRDVFYFLNTLSPQSVDFIFADPPYLQATRQEFWKDSSKNSSRNSDDRFLHSKKQVHRVHQRRDVIVCLLSHENLLRALMPEGILVLETSKSSALTLQKMTALNPQWHLLQCRIYGDTALHFLTPNLTFKPLESHH